MGNPESGDECVIMNHMQEAIGRGVYNSHSLYVVRVLARPFERQFHMPLAEIISSRVSDALDLRRALGLGQPGDCTVFRLLNGEGDGISGIIADLYAGTAVVECSALWGEINRSIIEQAIQTQVEAALSCSGGPGVQVIWKSVAKRLLLDGYPPPAPPNPHHEDPVGQVVFENGVRFKVFPGCGQKTGFYCDQRGSRLMLRNLAGGG